MKPRTSLAIAFLTMAGFLFPAATSSAQTGVSPQAPPMFGVTLRSSMLEERFHRVNNEQEQVSKQLMNTNVTGSQTTVTETRLKIIPDEKSLRFELLSSGDVNSQTTGFNPQATVDSLGQHHFEITKPLWFDGSKFLTVPAHGTIQASQTPQRVFSRAAARMPLLGRLTNRVAWSEVLRRTPQINQAVAEEVSKDVVPRVDRLIDEEFAKRQKQWTRVRQKVNSAFGSAELHWSARSSQDAVMVWAESSPGRDSGSRVEVPREVAALRNEEAVVLFVSEQAVESLLAQHVPAGLKLTDRQLQQIQASRSDDDPQSGWSMDQLMKLADALRDPEAAEPGLFTLELAPARPLQIRFVDGDVRVIATFQIHPKGGAPSGWMTTTFNLRGKKLSDEEWTIAIRSVDVNDDSEPAAGILEQATTQEIAPLTIPMLGEQTEDQANPPSNENVEVTTVQAGTMWTPIIRGAAQSLAEKIPAVKLPIEIDGGGFIPDAPCLRLAKIDAANSVLRIALRIAEPGSVAGAIGKP